jgi:hypothetical protein
VSILTVIGAGQAGRCQCGCNAPIRPSQSIVVVDGEWWLPECAVAAGRA